MARKPKFNVAKTGPAQSKRTVRAGTARNPISKKGIFGKWQATRKIRNVKSA